MEYKSYSYFAIKGDFLVNDITKLLGVEPTRKWEKGDTRKCGVGKLEFALWGIETYKKDHDLTYNMEQQCECIISKLRDKVSILQEFKKKTDSYYVLELVPKITKHAKPIIKFSPEVLKFCADVEAEIDIDYYYYTLPCFERLGYMVKKIINK